MSEVKTEGDALEQNASDTPQPWSPPTEEQAEKAAMESLAPHLTATEESETESKSEDRAKSEDSEQQEKEKDTEKQKENAEEKSDEDDSKERKEDDEDKEIRRPAARPNEQKKLSQLDKRIATLYIRNLTLSGQEAPEIDQVLTELSSGKYSFEQKMHMMNLHRMQNKQLRGVDPKTRSVDDQEDQLAIREAQKDEVRQEVVQEEQEKAERIGFVQFMAQHPELDEEAKEFNPVLARAVERLWKGGLPIDQAFETVTSQIEAVKAEQEKAGKVKKQKALSGAMSASTQRSEAKTDGEYTWAEFNQLMVDDPAKWERLVREDYKPKG